MLGDLPDKAECEYGSEQASDQFGGISSDIEENPV